MTLKDELVALAVAKLSSEDIMKLDKCLAATSDRVLMDIGVYS